MTIQRKHLISIDDLNKQEIDFLLDRGKYYLIKNRSENKKVDILKGKTVINIFFEDSTRTRISFEMAAKRLSADVINMQVANSSINKGESITDTIKTLDAMLPDFLVIRHNMSGILYNILPYSKAPIINAGDGCNEHPSQALLDALTIIEHKKSITGKVIAICGDIIHSRVARSNILLLSKLGAIIHLVGPSTLLPIKAKFSKNVKLYSNFKEGIKDVDVVMMLRLQKERMTNNFIPSLSEYNKFFGLKSNHLGFIKNDAIIMHPAPINRGVEIDSDVVDNSKLSVIFDQVETGVAIRQAIFDLLK